MINGFNFGEINPSEGYLATLQQRAAEAKPYTLNDVLCNQIDR